MADPSPFLVQFPQVVSPPAVENIPIGSEPVRMSCIFTLSPRPLTISPFSVRAVSLVRLACSELQVFHALAHDHALGVLPWTFANAIARVDARVTTWHRRAQVCSPVGLRRAGRPGQSRAMCVSTFKSAEVRAIALPDACHKKRHAGHLSLHRSGRGKCDRCQGSKQQKPKLLLHWVLPSKPGTPDGKSSSRD